MTQGSFAPNESSKALAIPGPCSVLKVCPGQTMLDRPSALPTSGTMSKQSLRVTTGEAAASLPAELE